MAQLAFLSDLEYCVKKLVATIKGKADEKHQHSIDDISETNAKKILTSNERDIITLVSETLSTDGDGTKVLYNDGTYKPIGTVEVIDNTQSLDNKTYSSSKIDEELGKKAESFSNDTLLRGLTQTNIDNLHTHSNKEVLDGITEEKVSAWDEKVAHNHENKDVLDSISQSVLDNSHTHTNATILNSITEEKVAEWDSKISHSHDNKDALDVIVNNGDGKKILTNKGEYVSDVRSWTDLTGKPFDTTNSELFTVTEDKLSLKYPIKPITLVQYNTIKDNPVSDTIYIVTDETKGKNAIYMNGKKYGEINDTSILLENGDGTKFLNDKREYAVPNYSAVLKDTKAGDDTTYSSTKIEERLSEVEYNIATGTEGNLALHQKTLLNVGNGDNKYFDTNTTTSYKTVIQAFKYVSGDQNISEVIKNYDNTDAENFNYNSDTVEFGDDGMKIKDTYTLTYSREGDYYISEPFNKDDFIELNSISI